jgi:hypothetical protein
MISVPFSELKKGKDYYVQAFGFSKKPGHTLKAFATNCLGVTTMKQQEKELDTFHTGKWPNLGMHPDGIPLDTKIALFKGIKPLNSTFVCDLCQSVKNGGLMNAKGEINFVENSDQGAGFKFYEKKAMAIATKHVFTSKQNTDGNNPSKPHINWSKDHGVIQRTGKLGGRKRRRTRRRKTKRKKRKRKRRRTRRR